LAKLFQHVNIYGGFTLNYPTKNHHRCQWWFLYLVLLFLQAGKNIRQFLLKVKKIPARYSAVD